MLQDNKITRVPPEIGMLHNLTDLRLDNNELISIPAEICMWGGGGEISYLKVKRKDNHYLNVIGTKNQPEEFYRINLTNI